MDNALCRLNLFLPSTRRHTHRIFVENKMFEALSSDCFEFAFPFSTLYTFCGPLSAGAMVHSRRIIYRDSVEKVYYSYEIFRSLCAYTTYRSENTYSYKHTHTAYIRAYDV